MKLSHNIGDLQRSLANLTKSQVPFATAMALNDTAKDAFKAMQESMKEEFDRPTRFTLNAFMVWRATKSNLTAYIRERNSMSSRHYLKIQSRGGPRPQTGFEKAVSSRMKYAGIVQTLTPAKGARLDSFGNLSVGQRNQIMSAIKVQRDASANATEVSRMRNKARAQYFVPRPGSKLSPGVWERNGETMTKVINFSDSAASYSKRIDFHEVAFTGAEAVYRAHFERHLLAAIRSAR